MTRGRYWAPIAAPADRLVALQDADALTRIAIFCDAYGLPGAERARLVPVACRWLRRSRLTIKRRARERGGGWDRVRQSGLGERLERSAAWIEARRRSIEALLR